MRVHHPAPLCALLLFTFATCASACTGAAALDNASVVPQFTARRAAQIGTDAVGFDDIVYAPSLDRVLVPSGETGNLGIVEPRTGGVVETVEGFSKTASLRGGHTQGPTSAAMADDDFIAVIDRTSKTLSLVDPIRRVVVTSLPLGGSPDYVRFEATRHELWVTEPEQEKIEIIQIRRDGGDDDRGVNGNVNGSANVTLAGVGSIDVPGGPESLVFDSGRQRAYTNLWAGMTVAIDLETHALKATFKNGCEASRTLALDGPRALLFVACSEGTVSSIDLSHGHPIVGRYAYHAGIDAIAYDAARGLLYVPSAGAGSMAALSIGAVGDPTLAFEVATVRGASCVTIDGTGAVWICDPAHGQLLVTPQPPPPPASPSR